MRHLYWLACSVQPDIHLILRIAEPDSNALRIVHRPKSCTLQQATKMLRNLHQDDSVSPTARQQCVTCL